MSNNKLKDWLGNEAIDFGNGIELSYKYGNSFYIASHEDCYDDNSCYVLEFGDDYDTLVRKANELRMMVGERGKGKCWGINVLTGIRIQQERAQFLQRGIDYI